MLKTCSRFYKNATKTGFVSEFNSQNKHDTIAKSAKSEMFFVNYTHNKIKQTKDLI